ncbi:hypothetical protein RhiirC2_760322 [Rhizophagus irregularis]|uniref:Peptidase M12A domain-containing protein n=1 Tax=Rhizophagus irregularis TaxID=588596 RepID=A0A2N1MJK5_9GLOM|nr:hypothetical protein RhiirC2_760322 [Rhizophagus irregularis]
MHNLMHVLGFYHEHYHHNRDIFLKVRSGNKNYQKQLESDTVCYGPYDPESIRHYSLGNWRTRLFRRMINTQSIYKKIRRS